MQPQTLKTTENSKFMENGTYVIYSDTLKGFLSNDGTSLTTDISKAMHYPSIGQAMTAAYKTTERLRGIFRFYKA